MRASQIQYLW